MAGSDRRDHAAAVQAGEVTLTSAHRAARRTAAVLPRTRPAQQPVDRSSLKKRVAIVGADETDSIGIVPDMTPIMMHAQAARNALRDAGIDKSEVDAVFTCGIGGMASTQLCEYLGIIPKFTDSTMTGGSSRWIAYPFHIYDCCLVTDAGGAIVVVGAERARDFAKAPVWVLGSGEASTHQSLLGMDDITRTPARYSGKAAFEMAGVSHG